MKVSISQSERQGQQACISRHGQSRQNHHNVPTGPELALIEPVFSNFGEELLVALLPPEETEE